MSSAFPGQLDPAIWTFLEWLGSGVRYRHLCAQQIRVAQGREHPDPLTAIGIGYDTHRYLRHVIDPLARLNLLGDNTWDELFEHLHSQCKCMGA